MWRNEVEVAILVPGCRSASLKLQPTLSRSQELFLGFKSKFRPKEETHAASGSHTHKKKSISLFHWKAEADLGLFQAY